MHQNWIQEHGRVLVFEQRGTKRTMQFLLNGHQIRFKCDDIYTIYFLLKVWRIAFNSETIASRFPRDLVREPEQPLLLLHPLRSLWTMNVQSKCAYLCYWFNPWFQFWLEKIVLSCSILSLDLVNRVIIIFFITRSEFKILH